MGSTWEQSVSGLLTSHTAHVSAEDVAAFVRLSGDDYEAHTDPEFMARSSFGAPIAHGALLVGYMSAAGTKAIRAARALGNDMTPVSLGYDRMRFVGPVYFGDTVTVSYRVKAVDAERARSVAEIEVTKQDGTVVAVAEHVMKWLKPDAI
jgi:Acyl dehydratase